MPDRPEPPFPTAPDGGPLRLAFVGQQTFFRACAMDEDSPRITTRFLEFREGRDPALMRSELRAFDPHAVVVFRPETLPHGLLADVPAPIVGFLTEPISRAADGGGAGLHWDLEKRRRDVARLDRANVDRLVSFDPLIVATVDPVMEVWRSLPIPVADALYRPVTRDPDGPPRMLFVGRSTVHRERWLRDVKHRFDCLHVAFGIQAAELERLLARHEITFNIHNEPYPSFENRVLLHLAAGHLVISEPLSPTHGLEPGFDYLEVADPDALTAAAAAAYADPDSVLRIRVRGRQKAELFRASRVWPALIRDLFADLHAFGTHRQETLTNAAR
jgi:hypothetical protein